MKKKKRTVSSNVSLKNRIWKNRQYYLLILPAVIYVLIFCYAPMYGLQIAFKDYKVSLGILGSRWVGFRNFTDFFNGYYFWNLIRNTFALSLYTLFVGFPVPILVALVVNELSGGFKRVTQTVLYAPHFISTVVIVGMITILFSPSMGVVNTILNAMGMDSVYFLGDPKYFRHLYVWSGVWQDMGWGAIIYIAALSGIDPCLHEAASIDGASRLQRILHINIPGILPTIIIMLILQIGNIMNGASFNQIFNLYSAPVYGVGDILDTYVQRYTFEKGANFGYTTAVSLFKSLVGVVMITLANKAVTKAGEQGLF